MTQASTDLEREPGPWGRRHVLARGLAGAATLAWIILALGVVTRVVRFADNRALWHDEAMLALNLLDRGFLELLRPLDHVQAAPPLFLLAQKLAVVTLGETEYALRLLPLLAGIASLFVFRYVTTRLLPGVAGLAALALFAIAEPLVYWSAEVKQYSLDVLAAVVLLALAAEPLLGGRISRRRAAVLALAGIVALFSSYAAIFVVAGIGAALVAVPLAGRRRPAGRALVVSGAWLVGVGVVAALIALTAGDVRKSLSSFLSGSGSPSAVAQDVWRAVSFPGPFARTSTALVVVLALLGALALRRRSLPVLAAVVLPIAATAAAALLQLYPFHERFVLFLVPLLLLLVGAGVAELRRATSGRTQAAWILAFLALMLYPAARAASYLVSPPKLEETRDVLRPLDERWRPGDSLFVAELAVPALAYYAECDECGVLARDEGIRRLVLAGRARDSEKGLRETGAMTIADVDHIHPAADVAARLAQLDGRGRTWVLLSSGWDHELVSYVLDCMGRRLESFEGTNAAAYLYDFAAAPARSAGCLRG